MSLFSKLSSVSRARKWLLFNQTMCPKQGMKILDVGAQVSPNGDSTFQFTDKYPWKEDITALNISEMHILAIGKSYPNVQAIVGDACALPWPDKHFDIVYSNAVIEHVGNYNRQKQMAEEIMRVGKRWFVTTPNRWFPFEFHLRLPFVTWLPGNGYLRVGEIVAYNHELRKYTSGKKRDDLRLMTAGELQKCFPTSDIIKQRITFMAETLIVIGGNME